MLPSLTLLEKLKLGETNLGYECDGHLLAALGNLKYLKELDLSRIHIYKTGAEALARVLPSLTLLEKLKLGETNLGYECDGHLLATLGNLKYLKELYLGKVYISETGAESLAHVLPSLTFLEKLELREIDLDYECDEQLFAALGNLKYLKELHLSWICIRKTGAEALARVLPSLTLLEKLVLEEIDFDGECDEHALFASLGNLKYLKVLDLGEARINKTGAATLTTTLPRLRSLKTFLLPRIENDEDGTLKNNLETAASFVPEVC